MTLTIRLSSITGWDESMNVILMMRLEKYGFEPEKDNKMVLRDHSGRVIAVIDKTGYTILENEDEAWKQSIIKIMKRYEIKPSGSKVTIEEKFDPEVLIRNGFYYDKGDTNYYCKDFKTHTVCIDKKFGVHFYAENMEKFLSDIKDREERWKLRFKKMGIAVKKFEEPEEYE